MLALSLSLSLLLVEANPAVITDAAGRVRVDRSQSIAVGIDGDRGARLVTALRSRAVELGLSESFLARWSPEALHQRSVGRSSLEIVRVAGSVRGVPLLHPIATALVDLDDGGTVRLLTTGKAPGPVTGEPVRVDEAGALARLTASGLAGSEGATAAALVAVAGPTTRLAYRIDPPLDLRAHARFVFLVDAHTGEVAAVHDRVQFAKVRAFASNPVSTPSVADYDLLEINPGAQILEGPRLLAQSCTMPYDGGCDTESVLIADADGNFLADPSDDTDPSDAFSEGSMYYHADKFLSWLDARGFAGLNCTQDGGQAVLVANFRTGDEPRPYDNAYFSGDCEGLMVFGQGTEVDFAYDGDVIYHELGHGVVEVLMGDAFLGNDRNTPHGVIVDALGLNEAIADFLSSSFAGDPLVGEYVGSWSLFDGYLRDNGNDFACPDDLQGEAHLDGEPYAALLWRTFEAHGDAVVGAVLDTVPMLVEDSSLDEAAAAFAAVVEAELDAAAVATVEAEIAARGLEQCSRTVAPGAMRGPMYVQSNRRMDPYHPPPLQFRIAVPSGATSMHFSFATGPYPGDDTSTDYVPGAIARFDTPVEFTYADRFNSTEVTATYDDGWEEVPTAGVDLALSGQSEVYVAIVNFGPDYMLITDFEVTFEGAGGTETDGETATGTSDDAGETGEGGESGDAGTTGGSSATAGTSASGSSGDSGPSTTSTDETSGTDGGGDEDGGCDCRSSGGSAPAGGGLLALVLVRRRRRVSSHTTAGA